MNEPLVVCVMLTRDRPQMAKRAVECFRSQTYQDKRLYVYDSGSVPSIDCLPDRYPDFGIVYHRTAAGERTIGNLRNDANGWACSGEGIARPDILIHFDDDDFSHSDRIAEQVALLQSSGKQVVGYRDMLFWRTHGEFDAFAYRDRAIRKERFVRAMQLQSAEGGWTKEALASIDVPWPPPKGWLEELRKFNGEAWLYSNADPRFCLGTSLCYYRAVWEAKPFPDCPKPGMMSGEDHMWLRDLDRIGETSLYRFMGPSGSGHDDLQPRMIASIHGGNSSDQYADIEKSHNWTRVPEFDALCRERMSL